MNNKQTARIIGHLGQDCTLRNTPSGDFLSFSIAVTHKYRDRQGIDQKYTQWFSCTTRQTNLEKYLTKGTMVMVEGAFEPVIYQTKSGQNAIDVRVSASSLVLLGSSDRSDAAAPAQAQTTGATAAFASAGNEPEDDLPF